MFDNWICSLVYKTLYMLLSLFGELFLMKLQCQDLHQENTPYKLYNQPTTQTFNAAGIGYSSIFKQ